MHVIAPSNLITLSLFVAFTSVACFESEGKETKAITLKRAVDLALEHNSELKREKLTEDIVRIKLDREEARFSGRFQASYNYEDIDNPQNAQELSATGGFGVSRNSPRIFNEMNHYGELKYVQPTRHGTVVEFGSAVEVLRNDLNRGSLNDRSLFTPEIATFTGVTITQPLLRGMGIENYTYRKKSILAEIEAAKITYEVRKLAVASEVARQYSSLFYNQELLKLTQTALENIEQDESTFTVLKESGKISHAEWLSGNLAVAQAKESMMDASILVEENRSRLVSLIGKNSFDESQTFHAVKNVLFSDEVIPKKIDLVRSAREKRYDSAYYSKIVDDYEYRVKVAENDTKSELNLTARAGLNGLAGDWEESYNLALDSQAPEFSVGLTYTKVFGKTEQKAELSTLKKELMKRRIQQSEIQNKIALEVGIARSKVISLLQKRKTLKETQKIIQNNVSAQKELLERGIGDTVAFVNSRQEQVRFDMSAIQLEERIIDAKVDLWLTSGVLLEQLQRLK